MLHPAVFLDRDGTINEEIGYIKDPGQYRLLPGAAGAVGRLNAHGIKAILVTNQSGLARGYYGEETVQAVMAEMHRQLMTAGAYLDAVYYCPHLPEGTVPVYAIDCDCRKPKPGLILRAASEQQLDIKRSFMIGDQPCDLETARRAGCRSILVLTGYGRGVWSDPKKYREIHADWVAEDINDAVEWILERSEGRTPRTSML